MGTYDRWFYSKINVAPVVGTIIGGNDAQTLPTVEKIELYTLSCCGDVKNLLYEQILFTGRLGGTPGNITKWHLDIGRSD